MISLLKSVGHEENKRALRRLVLEDLLPSSILFSGVPGIGKSVVARELARLLVCENVSTMANDGGFDLSPCEHCTICKLSRAKNLPDLYLVEGLDRDTWNTDSIRSLLSSLSLRSFVAARRVVILNDADALAPQALNALLKSLEEPREGIYFILIASNPSRLPTPIVSRCQSWAFDSLTPTEVQKVLEVLAENDLELKNVLAGVPADELALLTDGSLHGLQEMALAFDRWQEIRNGLDAIVLGASATVVQLAESLAKEKASLRPSIHLIRSYARFRMRHANDPTEQAKWAVLLSNSLSAERLILERHLSSAYVFEAAFLGLLPESSYDSFTRLTNSDSLLDRITL